jgi:catechol 2,3-dioxygenase-like lactoylglutathione lyase family enzyme
MITGAHVMIFSRDPQADREFLRDTLELPCIDSGGGWLIFKLPPAELGVHGGEKNDVHEFYLMCDDVDETVASLKRKGAECDAIGQRDWGRVTAVELPGGGKLGIYEPRHRRP